MIYDNVCWWAKKRGLTIHQIEQKGKIGNGLIAKWKDSDPSVKNLRKVASVLGVSVSTLLREDEKPAE